MTNMDIISKEIMTSKDIMTNKDIMTGKDIMISKDIVTNKDMNTSTFVCIVQVHASVKRCTLKKCVKSDFLH